MTEKTPENEVFSYCVGLPSGENPEVIDVYCHGVQVQTGTMKDAEALRDLIDQHTSERNNIYVLKLLG